ncbi:MAG: phasin family protein [Candidatus Glassbacteria bacterium]
MKEEKSFIQNALNLGFGLVSMTKDKIEKISADLVKRGELTREEARKWVRELEKGVDKEVKFLDKKVQKGVKEFIQKLKMPSRKEFDKLSREVSSLKREISRLKSQSRGRKKS